MMQHMTSASDQHLTRARELLAKGDDHLLTFRQTERADLLIRAQTNAILGMAEKLEEIKELLNNIRIDNYAARRR